MEGYTIFFTYMLESDDTGLQCGNTTAIHCHYINKLVVNSTINSEVNIYFQNINEFKFLDSEYNGLGFNANKISVLIQLINNTPFSEGDEIKPNSSDWKKFDVTSQITLSGYTSGDLLSGGHITGTIFKVPLNDYNNYDTYTLDYLNYPLVTETGTTVVNKPLLFGEEMYFLGNVSTEIAAIAYTSEIAIELPFNEYNSSTNETWDGISDIYITEVGIYDSEDNLVAIGKLNHPIKKNSEISRTVMFEIDF